MMYISIKMKTNKKHTKPTATDFASSCSYTAKYLPMYLSM